MEVRFRLPIADIEFSGHIGPPVLTQHAIAELLGINTFGANMPVVISGTEMERGLPKWRAETTGLQGEGPADNTLVIKFHGSLAKLSGLKGNLINIAEFRQVCGLVKQDWIPAVGTFRCLLTLGATNSITVTFSEHLRQPTSALN